MTKIHINAVESPREVSNYISIFADKIDYLFLSSKEKPRMITMSDSLVLTGIYSEYLDEEFGDMYSIINIGIAGSMSLGTVALLLEGICDANDIVININSFTFNSDASTIHKWAAFESNYDLLSFIDLSRAVGGIQNDFLTTFSNWNLTRLENNEESYEGKSYMNINEYGDYYYSNQGHDQDWFAKEGSTSFTITDKARFAFLNEMNSLLKAKGSFFYRAYPFYNINSLNSEKGTFEKRKEYDDYYKNNLNCSIISNIEDYGVTGDFFASDDFHLNIDGAKYHTRKLITDIKNQMEKDGLL